MLSQYSKELRWSYTASASIGVLQVVSTSAMARLLRPADFGVMALIMTLYSVMNYFAQFGVGRALVQKKTIAEEEVRGAFTVAVALGLACAGLMFIAAPAFTRFFHQAQATSALRLYSLSFILQGLAMTPVALLRRQLRIKRLAILDISAFVIGQFAFGIPAAYFGAGFWALIFSALAQSLVLAAGAYAAVRHSLRPLFRVSRYKDLLLFGGKASGLSVVEYLNGTADTFTLARMVSATSLGLYNRGFMLINLPLQYFSNGLQKVLLPALSREQHDLARMRVFVTDATRSFAAIVIPMGIGAALSARAMVFSVLGAKWGEAVPVFQWLCVAAVFNCLSHISGLQTEAMGKFRGKAAVQLTVLLAMVTGVYFGARYGIVTAAMAVAAVECFRCISLLMVATRLLECSPLRMLQAWVPGIGAAVVVGLTAALVDRFGMLLAPVVRLLVAITGCSLALIAYYRAFYPQTVLLPLSTIFGSRMERYVRRTLAAKASA